MKKPRGTWFFPLVLAMLMGGVSFWLDRISQIDTEEIALNPDKPKYQIHGIRGERFDADGQPREKLSAQRAWQLPGSPVINIDHPELTLFNNGSPQYQVSAGLAQYHTDTRQVVFSKEVVLLQPARAGRAAGRIDTSLLTVDTTKQSARTSAAVRYRYGLSQGTAVGFEYNREQGFLNLDSRIKAIIYDPKQP